MGLGEGARARRQERGLTQGEVAALGGLGVVTVAALEAEREDEVRISDVARVCLVLDLTLVAELTDAAGETTRLDLGPRSRYGPTDLQVPERLPTLRGEVAAALDELVRHQQRSRRRAATHLQVDAAYRLQVEELLLGRPATPQDDWDTVSYQGLQVDLVPDLSDRAQLVRTRRLGRWPGPVAEARVVPEGLGAAGAEVYRTLREDGRSVEEAERAAELLDEDRQ